MVRFLIGKIIIILILLILIKILYVIIYGKILFKFQIYGRMINIKNHLQIKMVLPMQWNRLYKIKFQVFTIIMILILEIMVVIQ